MGQVIPVPLPESAPGGCFLAYVVADQGEWVGGGEGVS